ncbi:DUF308 domain-containing protein [Methanolobus chelungpuianus]|uniref:DUF308 domain-containing protein n=1 Tax=Methanolobus chelungpuianus TaxID=502115 RepID=UPI002113FDF2|nr:DUF308 domain-containing protein [Methanolobus chelungpuianus]
MATTIYEYSINDRALLLGGMSSLIFGILLITWTGVTLTVIALLLGLWWLIQGLFLILNVFIDRKRRIWKLLSGIIGVLAGILVLQHPLQSALILPGTLVFVLGIMGMATGITSLLAGVTGEGWGIGAFGIISIIIGAALATNIIAGARMFLWVIAGLLLVEGMIAIYIALSKRSTGH